MLVPVELKFSFKQTYNSKRHAKRSQVGHVFNISFLFLLILIESGWNRTNTSQVAGNCFRSRSHVACHPVFFPHIKGWSLWGSKNVQPLCQRNTVLKNWKVHCDEGSPVNCINAKLRDYDNCTPVSIPILVLTVRVNHCRTIAAQDSTYTQRNSFTKYLALDRPFHYKITAAKDF